MLRVRRKGVGSMDTKIDILFFERPLADLKRYAFRIAKHLKQIAPDIKLASVSLELPENKKAYCMDHYYERKEIRDIDTFLKMHAVRMIVFTNPRIPDMEMILHAHKMGIKTVMIQEGVIFRGATVNDVSVSDAVTALRFIPKTLSYFGILWRMCRYDGRSYIGLLKAIVRKKQNITSIIAHYFQPYLIGDYVLTMGEYWADYYKNVMLYPEDRIRIMGDHDLDGFKISDKKEKAICYVATILVEDGLRTETEFNGFLEALSNTVDKETKMVLSEAFKEYILPDEDLHKLQNCLLGMFVDIKRMCDENNILYMMSGGTCLGAVRHRGFIPWDDDIDIMMLREEYDRFRTVFNKQGFEDYFLAEPGITEGYFYKMPKIYHRKTKLITVHEEGYRKFGMVSIDIFIIENAPESKLQRTIRAKLYNFAFHAASVCFDYRYPSKPIEEKCRSDREVKKYFEFRKKLGFLFTHIGGMKFYLRMCERLAKYPKKTSLACLPSGISYDREILPRSVFDGVTEGEFCGNKVNLPVGYDPYLRNLYKDYMEIPPVEKREIHVAYEMKL